MQILFLTNEWSNRSRKDVLTPGGKMVQKKFLPSKLPLLAQTSPVIIIIFPRRRTAKYKAFSFHPGVCESQKGPTFFGGPFYRPSNQRGTRETRTQLHLYNCQESKCFVKPKTTPTNHEEFLFHSHFPTKVVFELHKGFVQFSHTR